MEGPGALDLCCCYQWCSVAGAAPLLPGLASCCCCCCCCRHSPHSLTRPLAGAAGAELNPEDLERPVFPAGTICYEPDCRKPLSDVERTSLSLTVSGGSTMRLYRRSNCDCEEKQCSISAPNFATMLSLLEDDVKAAFLAEVEAWVAGKKEIAAARG